MKKLILLILLIPSLLFAGPLQQAHKRVIAGQTVAGGDTTECVGFDDQVCDGAAVPDNVYVGGVDRTYTYLWEATKVCTASRVRVYFTTSHTWTAAKVVVYRGTALIGTADITPSDNAWVWSSNLSAESGQNLSISETDNIYFGISVDKDAGYEISRDESGSNYYTVDGYLTDPATFSGYSRQLGVQLEYTY